MSVQSRFNQVVDESSSTGKALTEWYEEHNIAIYDQQGQLLNLYSVLEQVADIWPTLTKNEQSYYLNQQAGANQTQNLAAILSNFSTATEATTTALNSAGSAANENAAYMDSLEAKTNQVASSFEKLSNSVINSEVVKGVLDAINTALTLLNTPLGTAVTQFTLLTGVITGAIGVFGPIVGKISSMVAAIKEAGSVVSLLSTGFAGLSAATVPVAAILAGIVVAVGAVGKAIDYFTVSLEEQQEKVSSLSNELSNLQTEYNNLAGSENLTAADERRLQVLQAQIEANEILLQQEAQKQYAMTWGDQATTAGALDSEIKGYNDAQAELQSYQKELASLQAQQQSMDYGSDEWRAVGAEISEVTVKINEAQSKLNSYNTAVQNGATTEHTAIERLNDKINVYEDYQNQIDENNKKIIELGDNAEENADEIVALADENENLTEKASDLKNELDDQVNSLTACGDAMGGLDDDAQALVDRWTGVTDEMSNGNVVMERTASEVVNLKERLVDLAGTEFAPKDMDSMEEWLKNISETDFANIETMLQGLGAGAEEFSVALGAMDSVDVARLATQAVKNFTGAVSEAKDHMSEFETALQTDYTEGLQDTVQVMDYIQQSQQKGITNWKAYEAAMATFYGTSDEALIQVQESSAAINTAFNTAGTTMGNYQQYFDGTTFLADRFLEQLTGMNGRTAEQAAALEGVVQAQENSQGLWEVQIQDAGKLAEVLGLTEPTLMSMLDYMGSIADINIAEPVDAAHASLIELKSVLESTDLDVEVNADNLDTVVSKANTVRDALQDTLGVELPEIDTSSVEAAQEDLLNLQQIASTVGESITAEGDWDFQGLAEDIKSGLDESLQDDITIDASGIEFNTEEAANAFLESFQSTFSDLGGSELGSSMLTNLFSNMEVSGVDTAAQNVVNTFVNSVNGQLSTANIAWFDSIGTAGDQLGASLSAPISQAQNLQTEVQNATNDIQELNGQSLSSVTSALSGATGQAQGLVGSTGDALSNLRSLTSKGWVITVSYQTTGSPPSAPSGATQRARGRKGYALGKAADGAEYLRADQNGESLVGEEGPELLIAPDGSKRMVGQNGPEIINVNRGDTILPANVTQMLKNGQLSGFANGYTSGSISFKSTNIKNPTVNVTSAYSGQAISNINSGTSAIKNNTTAVRNNTTATQSNASAKSKVADSSDKATDETEELSEAIEEQGKIFDEENDILEHNIFLAEKNGGTQAELIDMYKEYQDKLHDQAEWYRQQGLEETSEEIRSLQKEWWNLEDEITDLQRDAFDERLEDLKDYIEERNYWNNWGADNEIAAWQRVVNWMDAEYAAGNVDYEHYLEEREDAVRKAAEAEKEAWEEAKEAQIDALESQINVYETLFNLVADKAQEEIDALENQRDEVEKYWDDKIDALQEANDELEEQIELEKAMDELARARQTKVMVYKDGRFQYINDIDAVSEAQANLDKLQRDQVLQEEVENLEKLKDDALAAIDEQIKGWEEYKEEWASVVDDYQKEQDELLVLQELGIDLEAENWETRLGNLSDYVDKYRALMEELTAIQNMQYQASMNGMYGEAGMSGGGGGGSSYDDGSGYVYWGKTTDLGDGSYRTSAEIPGYGYASVTIKDGRVQETSLPVGTIVYTKGGEFKITSSSSGSNKYTSVKTESGNVVGENIYGKTEDYYKGGSSSSGGGGGSSSSGSSGGKGSSSSSSRPGGIVGGMVGVIGSVVGGVIGALKGSSSKKKASGTLYNTDEGINLVGEEGPELRVLGRGDGVIPADITKNLWSWGSITPMEMLSTLGQQAMGNTGTVITIQNFSPNLPNVSDGESFANYLRNNFVRSVVQYKEGR